MPLGNSSHAACGRARMFPSLPDDQYGSSPASEYRWSLPSMDGSTKFEPLIDLLLSQYPKQIVQAWRDMELPEFDEQLLTPLEDAIGPVDPRDQKVLYTRWHNAMKVQDPEIQTENFGALLEDIRGLGRLAIVAQETTSDKSPERAPSVAAERRRMREQRLRRSRYQHPRSPRRLGYPQPSQHSVVSPSPSTDIGAMPAFKKSFDQWCEDERKRREREGSY